VLSDEEVAAVLSYARSSWGNQGGLVDPRQVNTYRNVPLD
jgi:mono/diheme cytochrome c family protein